MMKHQWSQYIAELIGTFFLVFLGCGSIILFQLDTIDLPSFVIPVIFGGTVSIMIYAVGHISGAHFNPAVTIAFCVTRKFPPRKLPGYIIAQCLGAISASALHRMIWSEEYHDFGTTFSQLSIGMHCGVEFILSFLLMFVIISVATDTRAVGEMAGIAIGTTVTMAAFVGGPLTGASMNPARSLGPATMLFQFEQLWIYILIPILGATCGAFVYEKIRCNMNEGDSEHGCC